MSKAALVDQVKAIQRSDQSAKEAWWDYCMKHLGGVKDPSRHEEVVLSDFLRAYSSGGGAAVAALQPSHVPTVAPNPKLGTTAAGGGINPAAWWANAASYEAAAAMATGSWAPPTQMGGLAAPGGGGSGNLGEFIKTGQRLSMNWKAAWQSYCALNGHKFTDPAKYDDAYIVGFMDYLGQVANEDLALAAAGQNMMLPPVSGPTSGFKRPFPGGGGMVVPAKRAHIEYTPNGDEDPEKTQLVAKVKGLQRADQAFKAAWWQYCTDNLGGIKDPTRHDAATLRAFLDSYPA